MYNSQITESYYIFVCTCENYREYINVEMMSLVSK